MHVAAVHACKQRDPALSGLRTIEAEFIARHFHIDPLHHPIEHRCRHATGDEHPGERSDKALQNAQEGIGFVGGHIVEIWCV